MNGNRVPWTIAVVSVVVTLLTAMVVCFVVLSPRLLAQEDSVPAGPVFALPVDGPLAVEPAQVDPAAVDAAVSNAITYQGVLRSGSAPATGSYDFQFQLFNAVTGGTQRGSTLVAENVPVSQGRFTTILNFGNVFGSEALWIAVGVRGGTSTGAFTALTPRQSLTAVPFAATSPALLAQVNTLKTQVSALQALLAGVSSEDGGDTLRITGRNLQVVSGSGATDGAVNGLGNLFVGYNEHIENDPYTGGSHNLIVGPQNTYTSYGAVVFGQDNDSDAPYASVFGGSQNRASAEGAVVLGGANNSAAAAKSAIAGGQSNLVLGDFAVISGGSNNQANGLHSAISGGYHSFVEGARSVIGGGSNNAALSVDDAFGYGDYLPLDPP